MFIFAEFVCQVFLNKPASALRYKNLLRLVLINSEVLTVKVI